MDARKCRRKGKLVFLKKCSMIIELFGKTGLYKNKGLLADPLVFITYFTINLWYDFLPFFTMRPSAKAVFSKDR